MVAGESQYPSRDASAGRDNLITRRSCLFQTKAAQFWLGSSAVADIHCAPTEVDCSWSRHHANSAYRAGSRQRIGKFIVSARSAV